MADDDVGRRADSVLYNSDADNDEYTDAETDNGLDAERREATDGEEINNSAGDLDITPDTTGDLETKSDFDDVNANATDDDRSTEDNDDVKEDVIEDELSFHMRKQLQHVDKVLAECRQSFSVSVDLAKAGVTTLPNELLELSHLQYLYLEGNDIVGLPENFFECFPNVKWLDLRRNKLTSIPSIYLGGHKCLQTLLLEGNDLRSLPLELGLVESLDGLNIRGNPIEFPPAEVLAKGVKKISSFLRKLLRAKSEGNIDRIYKLSEPNQSDSENSVSDEADENANQRRLNGSQNGHRVTGCPSEGLTRSSPANFGPVSLSAGLHRQTTAHRELHRERIRKFGSLTSTDKRIGNISAVKLHKTQSEKYVAPGEPLTDDKVEANFIEERRLARIRRTKMKQDDIIQTRIHKEQVKDWREESKKLQQQKLMEKRINGKIDFEEPATTAPFAIDHDDLKVLTNEERIARDVKEKHDKMRRVISSDAQQRLEAAKRARERELEEQVREHMLVMAERRTKPAGNPAAEMKAAEREMEIAMKLKREVEQRRKELEYQFTVAPSVAPSLSATKYKTSHPHGI